MHAAVLAAALSLAAPAQAAGDLPPMVEYPEVSALDLYAFPDHGAAKAMAELGAAYVAHLEECLKGASAYEARYYRAALVEARVRHAAWDLLKDAHAYGHVEHDSYHLSLLNDLRERIGYAAYTRGLMPCPVPLEYFTIVP